MNETSFKQVENKDIGTQWRGVSYFMISVHIHLWRWILFKKFFEWSLMSFIFQLLYSKKKKPADQRKTFTLMNELPFIVDKNRGRSSYPRSNVNWMFIYVYKGIYQNPCVRRFSGITFIRYSQNRKISGQPVFSLSPY
jgi:hypothetical protein